MSQNENKGAARRLKPVGIILALCGLVLFLFLVRNVGVDRIAANLKELGWGFLLIFMLGGVRKVVRALAWQRCVEPPHRLRFTDAFKAVVMGDTLGVIVPFAAMVVSEPSKAVFVRKKVPLLAGLSAIAVENLFYSLSTSLFIFSGMLALLLTVSNLKPALRIASLGTIIGVALVIPLAILVIRKQWKFLSGAIEWLYGRGVARGLLGRQRERVRSLEERVYGFYTRNRARFLPILLLEFCFHLAGVLEVYFTLSFISERYATLPIAFMFESVNRVINIVFKPIPMRFGVDEAGTAMLARALRYEPGIGETVAIIRKARDFCWAICGGLLFLRRGLSVREVMAETEAAVTEEAGAS